MFRKQNKTEIATAFIFGIASGLMLLCLYAVLIFVTNSILYSTSIKEFYSIFLSSIDSGIWLIIALSCLFGFLSVVMLFLRQYKLSWQKKVFNVCLFIIIFFAILASFCYHDSVIINMLVRHDPKIFLIFSVIVVIIISAYSVFLVRTSFIYIYKTVLKSFIHDTSSFVPLFELSENDSYVNEESEKIFSEILENIIIYAYRNNLSVGVASFSIKDSAFLIETYGENLYADFEKQIALIIKSKARIGENQCLIKNGAIFSVMYANEDSAYKAFERYGKNLKNVCVSFKNKRRKKESVPVSIAMAAAGFDFSKNKPAISMETLREKIMWKVANAIKDAESSDFPVIYYE